MTEQLEDVDRDTWTTPRLIADAVGAWDLDPCSNPRSVMRAARTFSLERGQNGLALAKFINRSARVWVNPPYSDVMPWVLAYGHTRFCFLVKFDPSTKWCAELLTRTDVVLFPKGERVAFDPPPGVPNPGGNQFPHGLFYARREDVTDAIRNICYLWRNER